MDTHSAVIPGRISVLWKVPVAQKVVTSGRTGILEEVPGGEKGSGCGRMTMRRATVLG